MPPTLLHSVIAGNACHNSLLWFIERVELLTPGPIQSRHYFLMHLEWALFSLLAPGGKLSFGPEMPHCCMKGGKGKENYRSQTEVWNSTEGSEQEFLLKDLFLFILGYNTWGKSNTLPKGMKMWRDGKIWLLWFVASYPPVSHSGFIVCLFVRQKQLVEFRGFRSLFNQIQTF